MSTKVGRIGKNVSIPDKRASIHIIFRAENSSSSKDMTTTPEVKNITEAVSKLIFSEATQTKPNTLVDGMYFSKYVEEQIPASKSDETLKRELDLLKQSPILSLIKSKDPYVYFTAKSY